MIFFHIQILNYSKTLMILGAMKKITAIASSYFLFINPNYTLFIYHQFGSILFVFTNNFYEVNTIDQVR